MRTVPPTTSRARIWCLVAIAAAAPMVVVACGDDDKAAGTTSTTTTAPASVSVSGQWVRAAAMGGNSAAYMTITGGAEDDRLVGASVSADVATKVELHETTAGGMGGAASGSSTTTGAMSESSTTMGGVGDAPATTAGGMMAMHPVDAIEIPAGTAVKLEPGGYHVMLIDLRKTLEVGDTVPITLTFEKAGAVDVSARVREG